MSGMLEVQFSVTLAEMGEWKNVIYLAFFVLAGLASALGKLKKRGKDKKDAQAADLEVELEAEIVPEPAPARKIERPPPSLMSLPPQPPAPPTLLRVPFPIEPARPTPRKMHHQTQEAQAKAAYQEQVETARLRTPLATDYPVAPKRGNVPPDVKVIRRLLAHRTGQRAAVALCEVLGPPIALRDSHLER